MLAYAAHRRRIAERHSAPHVMLAIIAGHIALVAAVMSAQMDLPERLLHRPTEVDLIPLPKPPPPDRPRADPRADPRPSPSIVTRTPAIVPLPRPDSDRLDPPIPLPLPGWTGPSPDPQPRADALPAVPVRVGPRFATPAAAVKPPYPSSRLDRGEEAVLKLRLSIDARGRVVAVDPVGRADPAFLAAARRHLVAYWRYRPATEDGRAIPSSTVITLRFELEG